MSMVEFDPSPNFHRSNQYPRQTHRGSPHLQHLDHHHPSAHSTPSPPFQYASLPTQQQQQQQQQLQQGPPPSRSTPTSYPSPAYPSPSMSAYHSSYSQSMPVPSLNLPPIRLNPPTTPSAAAAAAPAVQLPLPPPPQQQGRVGSPLMGSPLPQPSPHGYYPQHGLPPPGHHPSHITSSPHLSPRYPLPSASGSSDRIMSGGRHKKEIKRRTKTGCLTCRKRRIKCDEEHPSCKNCAKSKRDCLGYDPIFKPQPGPTSQQPAAIQPAPAPGGFIPHSLASVYTSSYAVSNSSVGGHNYAPTISTAASSPTSSETYDYAPIDPTLEAAGLVNPPNSGSNLLESQLYRPDLKRPLDRDSPFSSASDTTRVTPIPPRSSTPGPARVHDNPAKRIKIDDLLSGGSSSSQPLTPPSSEAALYANPSTTVENMKALYSSRYAPALDEFLETGWFMNRGLIKIRSDTQLVEVMTEIFERLKARGGSFVDEEDPSIGRQGKTAGVLWAGVKMCYGTSIPAADNRQDEDEDEFRDDEDGAETLRRINVVEALTTGQHLEPVPSPLRRLSADRIADNATLFWRLLGKIVTARAGEQIGGILQDCKQLVEGKDTRKLLYTIAEAKHVGKRPYDAAEDPATSEGSKEFLGELRRYIETVATSHAEPSASLNRRIAGLAVAQWREAITDMPFLC